MSKIAKNLITYDDAVKRLAIISRNKTYVSAAEEIGISTQSLCRSIKNIEKHYPDLKAKLGGDVENIPMSEISKKFHEHWTREDCIKELVRVCSIDQDKVVTRNYFRVNSEISESTWNRYFGSFLEYKRQSKVILSRHAHRMEANIAKHASVDTMRLLNKDKREWEGKYLRPHGKRWESVLVGSDQHDIMCDPFYRRLFIDTAKRVQPEKIVLNGDLFDLPEFSKHIQDPREFNLIKRIEWVHKFIGELRETCPEAEITLVEGNHEYRLLRHMGEETPALKVVLADLHGFTIPKLFKIDQYMINYIARADMTAFTERDIKTELGKNYVTFYDNALLYGHYPHMRSMGIPGANGHHHQFHAWSWFNPVTGPSTWMQIGAGHKREASYCSGERWSNGFKLAHIDTITKRSQFEYIDCSHDICMIGGKMYLRNADEMIPDLIRGAA